MRTSGGRFKSSVVPWCPSNDYNAPAMGIPRTAESLVALITVASLGAVLGACGRKDAAQSAGIDAAVAASAAAPASQRAGAPKPESAGRSANLVPIPADTQRACAGICERSRQLACKNASECMQNCMAMGALTPCTDSVTALFGCLLQQPVKNWECGEDGVAAIREGFCEAEQRKAVTCMEAKMKP